MNLTTTQQRLYDALANKSGEVVPYAELDRVISCKSGRDNLRVFVRQLRLLGVRIKTVSKTGYCLKIRKPRLYRKKPVPTFELDATTQFYAQDVQAAIHGVMLRHAEDVGFEAQIAILGVAIGAILHQLPKSEKSRFTKLLLKNVNDAPNLSQVIRMQ